MKVAEARKFSAETYVAEYLEDFNRELLPKTYEGKRLPEWLIKVKNCKAASQRLLRGSYKFNMF